MSASSTLKDEGHLAIQTARIERRGQLSFEQIGTNLCMDETEPYACITRSVPSCAATRPTETARMTGAALLRSRTAKDLHVHMSDAREGSIAALPWPAPSQARPDGGAIEKLFVDFFLEAHREPPIRIVLDLDATDDPVYGEQEGRHFHGYYDGYCYLPLYIFCGRHLLAAKLRTSSVDAADGSVGEVARIVDQIRSRLPQTAIVIRADSRFCPDDLMTWCEANDVQ